MVSEILVTKRLLDYPTLGSEINFIDFWTSFRAHHTFCCTAFSNIELLVIFYFKIIRLLQSHYITEYAIPYYTISYQKSKKHNVWKPPKTYLLWTHFYQQVRTTWTSITSQLQSTTSDSNWIEFCFKFEFWWKFNFNVTEHCKSQKHEFSFECEPWFHCGLELVDVLAWMVKGVKIVREINSRKKCSLLKIEFFPIKFQV